MKEVAAKAGVHHSTVSLCFRNHPRIPRATRERVLKVAREMGYRPHPYLTTLMHTRRRGRVGKGSEVLAFVLFSEPGDDWRKWIPELQSCIDQARLQAQARGFRLEEFEASIENRSPRRLADILYARGIKGVLVAPLHRSRERLDWDWDRFSVVVLGPSLQESGAHRVRHDHFQAMLTTMDECRRLGYRRVGLAVRDEVNRKLEQRWLGAHLLRQREFHSRNSPAPHLPREWESRPFLRWVERERLDAVIAVNVTDARSWLSEAGYRIPEDIGLVSLSSQRTGPLSGIYQDWPMQGKRAVTLLIDLLEDNVAGLHIHPNLFLVRGLWNAGATLKTQNGCPKKPSR